MFFPAGSTTATRVYGQRDDFATNIQNKGGISADSLSIPNGIAVDSKDNLYVVDRGNNRVLFFPAGSTTATRVYGQSGDFTTDTANKGGVSADSLYNSGGAALDSKDNLYISDGGNNRVLFFPAGSTTATRVYGQRDDFTTNIENKGGISADSLSWPNGIAIDSRDNLYVSEQRNDRVLFFYAGNRKASRVYGQGGSFTNNNNDSTLDTPFDVGLDSKDNLFVSDNNNSRVLKYATPPVIDIETVKRFCPEIRFHHYEKSLPCSIDYLLANSTLKDKTNLNFSIKDPTQSDLFMYWEGAERYFVDINSSQNTGGPKKYIYYCVQPVEDAIDITYILLYAWQGGQVAHVDSTKANAAIGAEYGGLTPLAAAIGSLVGAIAGDFDAILSNYGEHQGDIERVTVRIKQKNTSSSEFSIVSVTYEQHGDPQTFNNMNDLNFVKETHPVVAIGLGQHPTYNPTAQGGSGEHQIVVKDGDLWVFRLVDVISDSGLHWQPWADNSPMVEVGLHGVEPINDQIWAKFQGRFGIHSEPHLDHATYLDGRNLDSVHWNSIKILGTQVEAARLAILAVKGDPTAKVIIPAEDGPNGLNGRPYTVGNISV